MVNNQLQREEMDAAFAVVNELQQKLHEREQMVAAIQRELAALREPGPQRLASNR